MPINRNQDFLRRMPEASRDLRKRESVLRIFHVDLFLLVLLLMLACYGLAVLYSASDGSTSMLKRQIVFFTLGFGAMLTIAQVPLNTLARWSPFFYLAGIMLLIAVLVTGYGAKGAVRWLNLGGFRFQPSELLKLSMPIVVAAYFSKKVLPPSLLNIGVCLMLIAIPAALIRQQPDLGTSIIVASSGVIVLFFSGLQWRIIVVTLIALGAGAWRLWDTLLDYQRQRILTLFNPEADELGAGWNITQSTTAIGSGGWSGKGWLNGTQSHLDFLPESHTDFITAVLAEEFGFRGFIVLIILYLLIIARGLMIALKAQDTFSRLVASGITVTFFVYVFVNIGMVSGILPVVGVPLPLVSRGGTSLVTLMLGFGVLMAVSTQQRRVTA